MSNTTMNANDLERLATGGGKMVKSLIKIALQSKKIGKTDKNQPSRDLLIMGNGPSLKDLIDKPLEFFNPYDLLAVNFFANSPAFQRLNPQYYVLCDPHFFSTNPDPNVGRLWENIRGGEGGLKLFVPAKQVKAARAKAGENTEVYGFNPVGIEGPRGFVTKMFDMRAGMPRPRNVLIPSIMIGIWLGYRRIYLAGADHSWMKTLRVSDANEVISVQPHFYDDDSHEKERVASVYKNVRLHEIVESFAVAFRSYYPIAEYARRKGVEIYNVTPGSFIDAFPRLTLQGQ